MSDTFRRIVELVRGGNVQIPVHGYDEMAADGILAGEAIEGAVAATVVEDYPDYFEGPCTLVLQRDRGRNPIHVAWGNPAGADVDRGAGHSLSA
jgi:hypothetical protein